MEMEGKGQIAGLVSRSCWGFKEGGVEVTFSLGHLMGYRLLEGLSCSLLILSVSLGARHVMDTLLVFMARIRAYMSKRNGNPGGGKEEMRKEGKVWEVSCPVTWGDLESEAEGERPRETSSRKLAR